MYRPIVLPILLAILPAAAAPVSAEKAVIRPAPAPIAWRDRIAIEALLHRIYGRYRGDTLLEVADADIFTPDTLAILQENTRLLAGDVGAIDGDVFLDAQDFGRITIDAIRLAARGDGRVDATVRFSDPANDIHGKTTTLVVARSATGWRVHDVMLRGGGSYRDTIARENRTLARPR